MGLGTLKEHCVIAKRSAGGWPKKNGVALGVGDNVPKNVMRKYIKSWGWLTKERRNRKKKKNIWSCIEGSKKKKIIRMRWCDLLVANTDIS